MRQVILKKGAIHTEDVARPDVSKGMVLIRTVVSCISAGTELASIHTSEKPLIKRAMEQPEKVKKVLNWVRQDGPVNAYKQAKNELNVGTTLGYSLSGIVVAVGKDVTEFQTGDRVAAAGGSANHAEFVEVPVNLVTKIPDSVSHMNAATVAIGAIAMQSVRRADLRLGEFAVVIGCGLLGLFVIQMLKHSGVRIAATDISKEKLALARELGAELTINSGEENPVQGIQQWSDGQGADAVIFAAATQSNEPLSQAFKMCRRKGRVILLGVAGMQIDRKDIYEKEIDFMISTSYGPGRYDRQYEEKGHDYPYAYVRWTENRNLGEFIRLIETGGITFSHFNCNLFPIDKAADAFDAVKSSGKGTGITFLEYDSEIEIHETPRIPTKMFSPLPTGCISIGLVGAGNFARNMHIPNIARLNQKFRIQAVMDKDGYAAKLAAENSGAEYATTRFNEVLADKNIQLIMICTRHDTHGKMVHEALKAGKHVFVEKPLATNQADLDAIKNFYSNDVKVKPLLMVGFNRRFSKYANEIKKYADNRVNPLFIRYRMNAGYIPLDHWVHENGGRMVGEACHIIDLMSYLAGSPVKEFHVENVTPKTKHISKSDNKSIMLKFADGSVAAIDYFAIGSKKLAKEYMEVHFDQKTFIMDDYLSLQSYETGAKNISTKTSQKGHVEELEALYISLTNNDATWPIELWDLIQTSEIALELAK